MPWIPSPLVGVDRRMLERDGEEVARATSIVQYGPNSFFSPHSHALGEEFLVLAGTFSDETGDFNRGLYVRNPPTSKHTPSSANGCVIFVKLRQMHQKDDAYVRIDTGDMSLWQDGRTGESVLPLYEAFNETVLMCRWSSGSEFSAEIFTRGVEYYVLDGRFEDDEGTYHQGFWLRLPAGSQQTIRVLQNTIVYKKTGHLGG